MQLVSQQGVVSGPYHAGELAVQRQLGQADIAERVGQIICSDIPPQAATFLASSR